MAQYDELTGLLRELLTNRFSPKPRYVRGVLGDGLGNVVVPDRPDKSYARFSKNSTTFFEIFNRTVNPVNNWPILIGELPWQPGLTQVVDTDWSAFEQAGWGDTLGNTSPHAPTHEWPDGAPGSDAVSVHPRAIVPGRAFLSDSTPTVVYVNSFEYGTTGTLWPGLPGVDLQPLMSATVTGTMRYAGVYVDESTNSLGVVTGSTTVYTSALEPPRVSFPAANVIPIARVRVYGGQAGLVEADIKDARRLWGSRGSSSTGGGWPFPNIITVSAAGDYTTLQDAIDSVAAGGTGVIYADRATYTENLTISGKNITIKGQGNDPSLVMTYGTDPLVVIDGTVTLESDGTNSCFFTAIDCGFTATISGDNSVSGGGINLFVRGGYLYLPALSIDLAGTAYVTLLYSTVLHVSGPGNNAISINNTSGGTFTAVECNLGDITFVNANTTYYLTNTIYGAITSGTLGRSDLIGGLDVGDVSSVATGEALVWDGSKAVFKPGGGIVVTNTSGGAVAAGDVGYIDSAGEFKTTTTANLNASWAVVIVGGANSADIYVTRRGRVTVNYTGSDPAQGDYLVTSTTAGNAQGSSTMQPAIFAVCLAAGSSGEVEALLLCGRKPLSFFGSADVFFVNNGSNSDFLATINGAPSGTSVVYTPSAGNEESIKPVATGELAKLVLHNTTRGDYALISSVDTGTNTITLTANAPGTWQSGDTITTRSQTNTSTVSSSYFFDLEITSAEIDELAVAVIFQYIIKDSGAANLSYMFHPYESNVAAKRQNFQNQVANVFYRPISGPVPIIQRRFCLLFQGSGSGTVVAEVRAFGLIVAEP